MKKYIAVNHECDYRLHFPTFIGNDISINLQYFLSEDNVAFFPQEKTITLKDVSDKSFGLVQAKFIEQIQEIKNGYLLGWPLYW